LSERFVCLLSFESDRARFCWTDSAMPVWVDATLYETEPAAASACPSGVWNTPVEPAPPLSFVRA